MILNSKTYAERLKQLLEAARLEPIDSATAVKFQTHLDVLMRWNERMNLTAIRNPDDILSRHFVESIACAQSLPQGIKTLLDFGSGAGFPGIPIALCRPEIAVTLAESQSKKSAFLREALRSTGIECRVFTGRAEMIGETFDCVTLRAVDRMESAIRAAARMVSGGGFLTLMVTVGETLASQTAAGDEFAWLAPLQIPLSTDRVVLLGRRHG
jgi:16S rRNA (guanine527-N7)-methyltransferase